MLIKQRHKFLKISSLFLLVVTVLLPNSLVLAHSNKIVNYVNNPQPIVQSFNASKDIYPGMLVALNPKSPGSVIPLTASNIANMLGVVVPTNSAQIALLPANPSVQQVLVAESGSYEVLVSNQNGTINSGDYLTVSSIPGIAMKAGVTNKITIGQAQASLNNPIIISNIKLKGLNGKQSSYSISQAYVNLHLGQNVLYQSNSSGLPQFVIQAAYKLAKKPVNPVRIYLGFVIIFAVVLIVSSMFYSGTKNGIISIGRNPLSKVSIIKGLTQVIISGLVVFVIGMGLVYVIIIL